MAASICLFSGFVAACLVCISPVTPDAEFSAAKSRPSNLVEVPPSTRNGQLEGGPPPAKLFLPDFVEFGDDLRGQMVLHNDGDLIENLSVEYGITAATNGGFGAWSVTRPTKFDLTLLPHSSKSISIVGMWDAIEPHSMHAHFISVSIAIDRPRDAATWSFHDNIGFGRPPISVAVSQAGAIAVGSEVESVVTVWNPLRHPLHQVTVEIRGSYELVLQNGKEEEKVSIGTLGPNEMRVFRRRFYAVNGGYSGVTAWVDAKGFPPGSDSVSINPFRGAGDINEDTVVDDFDLVLFCEKYRLGTCWNMRRSDPRCVADLNYDEVVNEEDFRLFVAAYEEFVSKSGLPQP